MKFEKGSTYDRVFFITGYFFSYLIFTIMLFIVLRLLGKIEASALYDIAMITFIIALIGILLRRLLK